MVRDDFFTPASVATKLAQIGRAGEQTRIIADFAAGEGELLRAASARWPEARVVATDIDQASVSYLQKEHAEWVSGRVDFLNPRSYLRSQVLKSIEGQVDVVVLNPPFSCRGGARLSASLCGDAVGCSRAMAFVVNAFRYLNPSGEIRAVLPMSCLFGQKDALARELLFQRLSLEVVARYGRTTFNGCVPQTVIACLRRRRRGTRVPTSKKRSVVRPTLGPFYLLRGSVQMHSIRPDNGEGSLPLVHTTDLTSLCTVADLKRHVEGERRATSPPAVLLPRVGKPDRNKVVAITGQRLPVALSDCVFALECETDDEAMGLVTRIREGWAEVATAYQGTCAPYATLASLATALAKLGVEIAAPPGASAQYAQSLAHREG